MCTHTHTSGRSCLKTLPDSLRALPAEATTGAKENSLAAHTIVLTNIRLESTERRKRRKVLDRLSF